MCGIYGEFSFDPARPPGPHIDEAVGRLVHRGPDDSGTWRGPGVALAARRLSIIDPAGGHQPLVDETTGSCIVYNGELYNHPELRDELIGRGHGFRTRSDTEVVLRSYLEWGLGCLDRFNGMFAFGIYDGRDRSLVLARDRIGEKPLYHYADSNRVAFASEIKALLADPSIPRSVDHRGLVNYLAWGHSVAPVTMFSGIGKLPPGHVAVVRRSGLEISEYWDATRADPRSDGVTEREIVELLDDSVRRRLVADVPVGAFLSGGLDSSAVAALMTRHASGRVKTFTIGFTVGGAYDERPEARRLAEHLGTDHHEVLVDDLDLPGTLETLVYHYDEPFGDTAAFPLYALSRFARDRVTVVLCGDGGDELFGGYRRYAADRLAPAWGALGQTFSRRLVPGLVHGLPRLRRLKRAARTLPIRDPARRYGGWLEVFGRDLLFELVGDSLHDPAAAYEERYVRGAGLASPDHLNRLMYLDLTSLLPGAYMEKTDKATMACSLEARLPFLDHRLVEAAFAIPGARKVRGPSTKLVFKEAMKGLLPDWVLRRRKHGFDVPTDLWFRGPLKDFAFEVLLDEPARSRGYFDPIVVERLWKEHSVGRNVWDEALWLLMCFEIWHRVYLDGRESGVLHGPRRASL